MLFNVAKVFVAIAAATSVAASPPLKRQIDATTCDFVFKPDVIVASTTNLFAEFNYIIGRSLSLATGGSIFNTGSIIVENPTNIFNVENTLSADGKTAAQTAAIITSWAGTTISGPSANWLVQSVECI